MVVVSFDVWNTLLNIDIFYRKFSEYLSRLTGLDLTYVEETTSRAYVKMKEMRSRGQIRRQSVVYDCMNILLAEFNGLIDQHDVCNALSLMILREDFTNLVFDDVYMLLEKLRGKNVEMITIGNVIYWPGLYTRIILEKTGLGKFFVKQVYADEVGCMKPDPEIFKLALEMLNTDTADLIHVGDNYREDFQGALNAGFKAILIDRNRGAELEEVYPKRGYIVNKLSYVADILNNYTIKNI
ncbi:MAG: hypothetical protein DRJ32_07910 [Thermoprotei archaeon]|nr:MAG: hypothetical protein DRJ32_07910 [Thermoprotei archaeon]HDD63940.1 HAD family hydrolase [Thermoprotei archaeon]